MGGVHEHSLVECTPGFISEQSFHFQTAVLASARAVRLATDLHLEDESFSQAAMGWTHGLCIQLASKRKIAISYQRSAISFEPSALGRGLAELKADG